jgi:plasmid stabilization system protein ParE
LDLSPTSAAGCRSIRLNSVRRGRISVQTFAFTPSADVGVVYRIADDAIEVVRVFYAGQDYEAIMIDVREMSKPGEED